jgi:heptosyltransferase-3
VPIAIGAKSDRAYLDAVWDECDVARRDGTLDWPELSALIGAARVYIGPDTAVTHLAAATGTPTVALYGPTDPRTWGPWPVGGLDRPWDAAGTIQHRNNVWLVQNPLPCLPCQLEGCERRLDSHSQCLDELSAAQVVAAVDQALAMRKAA